VLDDEPTRTVCTLGDICVAEAAEARIEEAWAAAEPVTEASADWAAARAAAAETYHTL